MRLPLAQSGLPLKYHTARIEPRRYFLLYLNEKAHPCGQAFPEYCESQVNLSSRPTKAWCSVHLLRPMHLSPSHIRNH